MTIHRAPLVDSAQQQRQINDTIRERFNRVIAESSFILGPQAGEPEEAWARYCGSRQRTRVPPLRRPRPRARPRSYCRERKRGWSQQILSLTLYPGITTAQQEFVAEQLRASLEE